MPWQSAVRSLREFDEPVPPPDVDYEADYRVLDLPPGASLREIEDRARLMGSAFQPEGLPAALMVLARDRAERVDRAAEALSRYWKAYGKAPPTGEPARPRILPGGQAVPIAKAGGSLGAPPIVRPATGTIDRPRNHVHPLAAHPARIVGAAPSATAMSTKSAAAGRAASASDPRARTGARSGEEPVAPRGGSIRSWVLKSVMIGLVIAAAVRVQQYRLDHASPGAPGAVNAAIATAMPSERPAQWPGTATSRQMFGAAAPAISGHQRQN